MLSVFSSSKLSLFHNSNLFGSCIIHILYTGCAKIKTIIPAPKANSSAVDICLAKAGGRKCSRCCLVAAAFVALF